MVGPVGPSVALGGRRSPGGRPAAGRCPGELRAYLLQSRGPFRHSLSPQPSRADGPRVGRGATVFLDQRRRRLAVLQQGGPGLGAIPLPCPERRGILVYGPYRGPRRAVVVGWCQLRAVDRRGRYHAAQSATHRPPRLDRRDRRALASRGASSQAGQPVAAISRLRHDALAGGQVRPSPAGRSRPAAKRRSRSLPPRRGHPVGTPRRSARPGRQCGSGAGEDQLARPGAAGFAAGLTARLTARHRLDSDDAVAAGRP